MKQADDFVMQPSLAWLVAAGLALVVADAPTCLCQERTNSTYSGSFHSTLIDDGKDLIFPTVIRATDYFKKPLAKFYLYTSPRTV